MLRERFQNPFDKRRYENAFSLKVYLNYILK